MGSIGDIKAVRVTVSCNAYKSGVTYSRSVVGLLSHFAIAASSLPLKSLFSLARITLVNMFAKQITSLALSAIVAAAPLLASAAHVPRNTPSPVLIGYAHNWDEGDPYQGHGFDGTAPYIRLVDFPATYNVLVVSFATGDAQSGTVSFVPKMQTPEAFRADVQVIDGVGPGAWCGDALNNHVTSSDLPHLIAQAAKKQGRRIVLSVGGADGSFPITSQNVAAFTKSLASVIEEYDFVCAAYQLVY